MVGAPGVGQRDELAQREERDEAEQQRRAERARRPRRPRTAARRPRPRAARARSARCSAALLARRSRSERPKATSVTSSSTPNRTTNSRPTCWLDAERAQAASHQATVAQRHHRVRGRGRGRRAAPRPGCSAIGAPKTTVHRIGTGTTSPLGMTRCTLSIQAGISCTSGNAWASANRPRLERRRLGGVAARAFGEDDQRVAVAQRFHQRLERVLVVLPVPSLARCG